MDRNNSSIDILKQPLNVSSSYNFKSSETPKIEDHEPFHKILKESCKQTFEPVLEPVLVPVRAYGGASQVPVPILKPAYALKELRIPILVPEYTPPVQVPILKPEYALWQIP
jgi:hypothetical protein